MTDADRILAALRQVLREQGLTYAELARRLHVSEVTVKRMFSGRRISLERLQQACDAVGISLFDLGRRARAQSEAEPYRLTIAQERRLVADVELFYFFWMIVHRHGLASICRRYRVSLERARRWLGELDRMGIIELRPGDRFALKVPSNVVWNEDGPIERLIVARSLPVFMQRRFRREDEYFRFVVAKLTPESIAAFRARMREVAEQIFQQSVDIDAMRSDSRTIGAVVAFGPADFSLRDVVVSASERLAARPR